MLNIAPQPGSRVAVVNLKIAGTTAVLTAPAIALQHPLAQLAVGVGVEAEPRAP